MRPIPYGKQWIDDDDTQSVINALEGDWMTQDPIIKQFEKKIAEYISVKFAIADIIVIYI